MDILADKHSRQKYLLDRISRQNWREEDAYGLNYTLDLVINELINNSDYEENVKDILLDSLLIKDSECYSDSLLAICEHWKEYFSEDKVIELLKEYLLEDNALEYREWKDWFEMWDF